MNKHLMTTYTRIVLYSIASSVVSIIHYIIDGMPLHTNIQIAV